MMVVPLAVLMAVAPRAFFRRAAAAIAAAEAGSLPGDDPGRAAGRPGSRDSHGGVAATAATGGDFRYPCAAMKSSQPCCPVCRGETIEIRAKLVCRVCGTILETCCEGGPMGQGGRDCGGAEREAGDVSADVAAERDRGGRRDAGR
jgi:hypothetical protein